jgi:hypothetical protein
VLVSPLEPFAAGAVPGAGPGPTGAGAAGEWVLRVAQLVAPSAVLPEPISLPPVAPAGGAGGAGGAGWSGGEDMMEMGGAGADGGGARAEVADAGGEAVEMWDGGAAPCQQVGGDAATAQVPHSPACCPRRFYGTDGWWPLNAVEHPLLPLSQESEAESAHGGRAGRRRLVLHSDFAATVRVRHAPPFLPRARRGAAA